MVNYGLKYLAMGSMGLLAFAIVSFVIAFIYHNNNLGYLWIFSTLVAFLLGVLNRVLSLWLRQDMKRDSSVNVSIVVGIIFFIFWATIFYVSHSRAEAKKETERYLKDTNSSVISESTNR
jgi:ABC-type polysaccharide/polyol phosphate export permease